jgi:hypothetical protein
MLAQSYYSFYCFQDASRLTDLCRQCIIFDCIADLVDCLRTIEADPETRLLRIKNRMDPGYNAQPCGGYRDVALNLHIVSQLTSSYAVDAHVCEVQLILRPFAEVKVSHVSAVVLTISLENCWGIHFM